MSTHPVKRALSLRPEEDDSKKKRKDSSSGCDTSAHDRSRDTANTVTGDITSVHGSTSTSNAYTENMCTTGQHSTITTRHPVLPNDPVIATYEQTGASNVPHITPVVSPATYGLTSVGLCERPATIDGSVCVSTQGVTYNIGESAVVNFRYGAIIGQRLDKHPLDGIIRSLERSHNAEFNMVINTPRGPCTPQTRTTILQKLGDWCNATGVMLYWMNGMVGTGKTTIAYSVCQMLESANLLGASFFCSRSVSDCQDVNIIISTIAFQLAQRYPPFAEALAEGLHKDGDILRRGLDVQLHKLIIEPWNTKEKQLPSHIIVVIDGLDECRGDPAKFLRVLFAYVAMLPFKILTTSRPEFSVYNIMKTKDPSILSTFILHEVDNDMVQADIAKYLESELSSRTTPEERRSLTKLSGSLFIYAATLAKIFKARNVDIRARLRILQTASPVNDKSKMMTSLDELYKGVLATAFADDLTETEIKEIKEILYVIVCAHEPLTRQGIAELWNIEVDEVERRLESLLSVISVPGDVDGPVTVFHASFPDFMLDQLRSGIFYCHPLDFHLEMFEQCLALMKSQLHPNLCNLDGRPPNDSIDSDHIHKYISPSLRYATVYWSKHWMFSDCSKRQATLDSVKYFLTTNTLCWFECLSLVGQLAVSVHSLEMLRDILDENTDLATIVYDRLRFIQQVYNLIEYSALQTYHSALVWIPLNSPLRTHYASLCEQPLRVLYGLPTTWAGPDQAINIHSNIVYSIAISQDGCYIISGSKDKTVRIWNVCSHVEECVLRGHTEAVNSIAIFGDESRVVSGSHDESIRVWNISTHEAIFTLQSDSLVMAVAVSPDDRWIASGHSNGSVRVWDAMEGRLVHSLKENTHSVQSISFTHDGTRLVSGSLDKAARIWNVTTGAMECVCRGHTDLVMSVACSPNNDKIATGSWDSTARLWDMSGNQLHVLRAHSSGVSRVAFMPDGKQIVTGSGDRTLRIWDVTTGGVVCVFSGLAEAVESVAVFPDGLKMASSSGRTIAIWSLKGGNIIGGDEKNSDLSGSNLRAESMAFSANGRRVLLLPSLRILDTATLEEKAVLGSSRVDYHRGALATSGSRVAAVANWSKVIEVWELTGDNAANHFTLQGHTDCINSFSFAHNDHRFASASDDKTARVWDATTAKQIHTLNHPGQVYSAVFSHDDTEIISYTSQSVHIWNAQSGEQRHKLDSDVLSVVFSRRDRYIITSRNSTISIRNAKTFQLEHTYEGYRYWATMSDNSSYALSDNVWICHFPRLGDQPRRVLWIPSQYRPNIPNMLSGPLFTLTSTGVQVCLPRVDGLVTLIIPHDA